jgi:hypothetical protein
MSPVQRPTQTPSKSSFDNARNDQFFFSLKEGVKKRSGFAVAIIASRVQD